MFCPYLGRDYARDFSQDHVFPDMIGGKLDFALAVSKEANSFLGTQIEAPAFDSLPFRDLRRRYGIKSRSGVPNVKLAGTMGEGLPGYELTHTAAGAIDHNLLDRVHMDAIPDQTVAEPDETVIRSGTVFAFPNDDSTLEAIRKKWEAKGYEVRFGPETRITEPRVTVTVEVDTIRFRQALAKIIYGAACIWLPGYAENDVQAAIVRSFFMAEDHTVAASVPLNGTASAAANVIGTLIPSLAPEEHAVFVYCDGNRLVGGVTVFGKGPWHAILLISNDAHAYGWTTADIRIAVCNPSCSKTEILCNSDLVITSDDAGAISIERK